MRQNIMGTGQFSPSLKTPPTLGEILAAIADCDRQIEIEEAKANGGASFTWLSKVTQERGEWARILDAARNDLLSLLEPPVLVSNLVAGIEFCEKRAARIKNALDNPTLTTYQRDTLTKQLSVVLAEGQAWHAAYAAQLPPLPRPAKMGRNRYALAPNPARGAKA